MNLFYGTDTSAELESIQQNAEKAIETVSKLDEVIADLADKAIALGINILIGLVMFVIGRFLIKLVVKLMDKLLSKSAIDTSVVKFLNSVITACLYIILLITICGQIGIETTSFAALVASGGLAIGLAFEGSLANFAGGVLILITKPFADGDYIESNGVEGTVRKIDIFYTTLSTIDNKVIKLPNGTVSNSVLTNYSMQNKRRVDVSVGIGYEDDIKKAKAVLNDVMNSYQNIMTEEDNVVVVKNLADSSIVLEIRMWVATEFYWDGKFYLNEQIKYEFDKAGVSIPFNQLDVNIKNMVQN